MVVDVVVQNPQKSYEYEYEKKHVRRDSKMCCCCYRFFCGAPATDGRIHAPVLHDASQIAYCRYWGRASLPPNTSSKHDIITWYDRQAGFNIIVDVLLSVLGEKRLTKPKTSPADLRSPGPPFRGLTNRREWIFESSYLIFAIVISFKTLRLEQPLNVACQRSIVLVVHCHITDNQLIIIIVNVIVLSIIQRAAWVSTLTIHNVFETRKPRERKITVAITVLCWPSENVNTKTGGIAPRTQHTYTYTSDHIKRHNKQQQSCNGIRSISE